MAALTNVTVIQSGANMTPTQDPATATVFFVLEAQEANGTKHRATATINGADFPTDQASFMAVLWTGAFLEAFDAIGHSIPDDPEWSPWPIV